jgi:cation:H+ antiporter
MGTTALILPIEVVDKALLEVDFLWMISISLLILPLVFLPKKMRLGRVEGAILLLIYILFLNQMFS